ncbi:neuronal acetylcholine receptor subunit alpha-6-like [Ylistrum balloti]|uniref:neuronal acetylcholine receptor subunit alpha-6-like n=1 Tax=Ylistrum balloti TaxID=509963 RepID=UPI002905F72A|nr:neuronal acetylcholine receptor subunit alpha-6-like [Ylistrum balloti]
MIGPSKTVNVVSVVVLTLLLMTSLVWGASMTDVTQLQSDLLTGYNKYVWPAEDIYQPVYVNITFFLVGIRDFDEVTGKFAVTSFMSVTWVDRRMTWNPFAYNSTFYLPFNGKQVWKPNIILVNPFTSVGKVGEDFMEIRYDFQGNANWSPGDVMSSACDIDVTYYPFDTQKCLLRIMPWGAPSSELVFLSSVEKADLTFYSTHGTWELISTKTESVVAGGLSYYNVEITMKRRPLFFVVNVVLPILFMAFLNSLVFVLPVDSGERVSYAITVLLAIAVFLTLVGDNLPKTSQPMSILCYFLLADLVMSSFVSIITILGLRVYYINDRPVPGWICRVVVCLSCGSNRKRNSTERVTPSPDTLSSPHLKFDNVDEKKRPKSRKIATGKQQITTVMSVKSRQSDISIFDEKPEVQSLEVDEEPPVTWKHVNHAIDKITFVFCLIWMFVICLAFFITVSNA